MKALVQEPDRQLNLRNIDLPDDNASVSTMSESASTPSASAGPMSTTTSTAESAPSLSMHR
ncbi:MAG: hypothetical protein RIG82_03290 [Phycisphaeraceae bacterium]